MERGHVHIYKQNKLTKHKKQGEERNVVEQSIYPCTLVLDWSLLPSNLGLRISSIFIWQPPGEASLL